MRLIPIWGRVVAPLLPILENLRPPLLAGRYKSNIFGHIPFTMNRSQYSLIDETNEQGHRSQERRWRSFRYILRRTLSSRTSSRTTVEIEASSNLPSPASRPPSSPTTTPAASSDTLVEKVEVPYTSTYPFAHMDPVLVSACFMWL
ncbi:hypothetical protein VTO73DRAFT_8781 [Trametes versicolor]